MESLLDFPVLLLVQLRLGVVFVAGHHRLERLGVVKLGPPRVHMWRVENLIVAAAATTAQERVPARESRGVATGVIAMPGRMAASRIAFARPAVAVALLVVV